MAGHVQSGLRSCSVDSDADTGAGLSTACRITDGAAAASIVGCTCNAYSGAA